MLTIKVVRPLAHGCPSPIPCDVACREAVLEEMQSESFIGERRPDCTRVRRSGDQPAGDATRSVERSQVIPSVGCQSIDFRLCAKCETHIDRKSAQLGPRV